jgi:hypothetical protein
MPVSLTDHSWCVLEFGDVTVLWQFNTRSDGNLDVMVLLTSI